MPAVDSPVPLDVCKLQKKLGVLADGILGSDTLRALFARCGAPAALAAELGLSGTVHMYAAGMVDTTLRLAHSLAQLGHESDAFRTMEEYASGAAYEGRSALGNTETGDGRRFKGRGPIQITGRGNYRRFGRILGIDLEQRPELALVPSIGLAASCAYWSFHGLNALADNDDLEGITRKINGGVNGLVDRARRLVLAKALLS